MSANEGREVLDNDEDADDGFDVYNPATWLVSDRPTDKTTPKKEKDEQQLGVVGLPMRRAKFKVFADEYSENDEMDESEVAFANHIYDANTYQKPSVVSPQPRHDMLDEEGKASPLNDPYGLQPYIVNAVQLTKEEEEAKAAERVQQARKKLEQQRAKYLVLGSELANADPDALLQAMVKPSEISPPKPPLNVSAIGKDGSATVWWQYDLDAMTAEARVTSWEVTRYRLLEDGVTWSNKGFTVVKDGAEVEKKRCHVPHLQNGARYRFAVSGCNLRGRGFESTPTEAVMVEAALPAGWFRFHDAASDRAYYSNVKTKQTSWARPEEDPFFLHENLVLLFDPAERAKLRELYEECIHLSTRISQVDMKMILLEVGEVLGVTKISRYFLEFNTGGRESIHRWDTFMLIMAAIKKKKLKATEVGHFQTCQNYTVCLPCYTYDNLTCCTQLSYLAMLDRSGDGQDATEKKKFGAWVIEWSHVGERYQYRNTITDVISWDAPEELRFYLPRKMEERLLSVFNPQTLEDFKVRYSQKDLDGSGNIDKVEFKMLLEDLGIKVKDSVRERLIRVIDLNNNGTIEFHEFCFLMLNLANPKSSTLNFLRAALPDAEALQQSILQTPSQPAVGAPLAASSSPDPSGCFSCICFEATQADYRRFVKNGDVFIDRNMLCKRPSSEHGSCCFCGCRRVDELDVFYWPFCSHGELEPITWGATLPLCCDD